ncbi:MAG: TIGR04282 family arsenosugar biosynthesis glycosyltransferase [Candidatus Thorarchaeota archaeon]|nr:MAG: TIGR04282 family arsenosugar biosynthesis glycosyltransferase [Candidatus Thorarchaeota archaeon]
MTVYPSDKRLQPGIFLVMKYPEAGKVKSRLAESLGEKAATALYCAFVKDTLKTVEALDVPFHIAVHPPESHGKFADWLGHSYEFFPQEGENLGERLHNGFVTMFDKEYQQVVALATDCPDLPAEILQRAISAFQTDEVVIGPGLDGGFYLIGFAHDHFVADAFYDISWGTETVFQETLSRIETVTNRVRVLPEWGDIDTKRDLRQFFRTHEMQPSSTLRTMEYLRSNPGLLQILFS